MFLKIAKNDLLKNKTINGALCMFVILSSLLAASGAYMIVELTNSINALFEKSKAPHFVQMHVGELDEKEIATFAEESHLVEQGQVSEMYLVDRENIKFGNNDQHDDTNVMDNYFVQQNNSFDFLLNMKSEIIHVSEGEVAVPLYYKKEHELELGDSIQVTMPHEQIDLIITDFVRDVQMNSSIIHSKRFVINESDMQTLKYNSGNIEYLIEFLLVDLSKLNEFRHAYSVASLPSEGPQIDYHLFKVLNALTDGIVSVVIMFVSGLLCLIAILCMRYTILATMEEEYREIGVMKAIGIPHAHIKRHYLIKYIWLTAIASLIGYSLSTLTQGFFTKNITENMGIATQGPFLKLVPFFVVFILSLIMISFCLLTLRKFNQITAVEALRVGITDSEKINQNRFSLHKSNLLNTHLLLALKDVFTRFKMYRLLLVIFIICAFIIIVPANFLNTIESPTFINYMGVEKSDIRIDIQQSDNIEKNYHSLVTYLDRDQHVKRYSTIKTNQITVINDGVEEKMTVDIGDFSMFPLEYVTGRAPENNEIALSDLNSKELEKNVGDTVVVVINGKMQSLTVSGIYQDVTNGGRTAKVNLPFELDSIQRYKINIDLQSGINLKEKINEYQTAFSQAKVTDINGYLDQTFGNTIEQLKKISLISAVIALFIAALITFLFIKMLIAKDEFQIKVMKNIGISLENILTEYAIRILIVLGIGIVCGTILANTIGQYVVSFILSFFGASNVIFIIDPIKAYVIYPLIFIGVVLIAIYVNMKSMKKSTGRGSYDSHFGIKTIK